MNFAMILHRHLGFFTIRVVFPPVALVPVALGPVQPVLHHSDDVEAAVAFLAWHAGILP